MLLVVMSDAPIFDPLKVVGQLRVVRRNVRLQRASQHSNLRVGNIEAGTVHEDQSTVQSGILFKALSGFEALLT